MGTNSWNVLLLSHTCDGTDVGETWSCCQWVKGLAQRCQVTLLTLQRRGRRPVAEQVPGAEIVAWDELPLPRRVERLNSMMKLGYIPYHAQARRWIRRALAEGRKFDLIHQVGPLAMRYPSPGVGWGIPLVIGPLAGSLSTPALFARDGVRPPWFARLRALDVLRFRFDPWLRRTYRSADALIGVAPYVADLLQSIPLRQFVVASETGVTELPPGRPAVRREPGTLRLLYVGRVIRTKGLRDVIRALALLSDLPGVSLVAAGDGEDLEGCRREADRLGVADRVTFRGRVPREEVETLYQASDAFVFPSYREPSGNVVFEAMRHGLPVVTTDRGGPGYAVDAGSGFTLPVSTPEQLAQDLAGTLRRLAGDFELRAALSRGARERVAAMALWDRKIDWLLELYEQVIRADGNDGRSVMRI